MKEITVSTTHVSKLIDLAQAASNNEICGIISGNAGKSKSIHPITNIKYSPTEYAMAPDEFVNVYHEIQQQDEDILAFYHSHPNSQPIPSETDIKNANYPTIPQIIIGKQAKAWRIKAFLLSPPHYTEIPIKFTDT